MTNLTDRDSHFEFGSNWQAYSKTIDGARIQSAVDGMRKLFPDGLSGKTFLDIGCGSGLHSLAALLLGASSVRATDIDENSVSAARTVLSTHFPKGGWSVEQVSVFDMTPDGIGAFDIVYSWGVLHHTGDMWRSIETASNLVKPGGQFAIAIYAKTAMDTPWKIEKRFYKNAPKVIQWAMRQSFTAALVAAKIARGKNPISIFRDPLTRGMNMSHDLHDWMGGYPYETATAEELDTRITAMGFILIRSFPIAGKLGLFGSGCHELVFRRF